MPEMKVLDDSEKKRVLKKYSITDKHFPKILSSDPAAVALKANAGDLIRITREGVTGKHTEYKVVVGQ